MNTRIKDIACCERPYEKAKEYGISSLSDAELLSIIIRTGTRQYSSIDVSNMVLNAHPVHKGLVGLNYLKRNELINLPGIGDTKATELLAVAELSGRINQAIAREAMVVDNVETIAAYYMEKCRFLTREKTFLVLLGAGNKLIYEICLSEGTINSAHLSPREIYIEAFNHGAVNIILIHNHPSGDVTPSTEDIVTTKQIVAAGNIVGIHLLDHIIVGHDTYFSMFERGILNEVR